MAEPEDTARVRPLDGIRVIEASSFLAGPFCATQLAEFGAEVVKVELPKLGDPLRRFGTVTASGDSLCWLSECRNKKSVTLDLRKPEGAEILKELVRRADVLVENFQPGTLEDWGLGWDALRDVNAGLVMVRISGYGQTGPYRGRPGFGRIANAFGALLALRARDLTGTGQVIDIGLYEPVFRILDELAPAFHLEGFVRQRMGPGTVNVVPHSHYPTRDGRWIAIACTNDKIFARLARAMDAPELADESRWGGIASRERDRAEVDDTVAAWTARHDRDELLRLCEAAQVPCGPVYAIDEIFADPQYRARENIRIVQDGRAGEVAVPNVVPRLAETPGRVDWLGPELGAHNEEIYGGLLGLGPERLRELEAAGVI